MLYTNLSDSLLPDYICSIVSYEHIDGYVPGKSFNIGDHVYVRKQNACPQEGVPFKVMCVCVSVVCSVWCVLSFAGMVTHRAD